MKVAPLQVSWLEPRSSIVTTGAVAPCAGRITEPPAGTTTETKPPAMFDCTTVRFEAPSQPGLLLPPATVTTRLVTVIGNDCGFVIVTGTGPPTPGARSAGWSPVIVKLPVGGGEGFEGGVEAGCSEPWITHVVQDGGPGIPFGPTERTQKVCCPGGRPTKITGLEHGRHPPESSEHSDAIPVATSKVKTASVEVVLAPGAPVSTGGSGSDPAVIVQKNWFTVLCAEPFTPRTPKTCLPSARPRYVFGETHVANFEPSSEHCEAGAPRLSQEKVAILETHGFTGTVIITGRGAPPAGTDVFAGSTISQLYEAGSPVAPDESRPRTLNVWPPSPRPLYVTGLAHGR